MELSTIILLLLVIVVLATLVRPMRLTWSKHRRIAENYKSDCQAEVEK